MQRRAINLAILITAGCPPASQAQPSRLPTVGYLANASPAGFATYVAAFRGGLAEMGFVEGRDIKIEYRWAEGKPERLRELADDLVRRKVNVIVATGGTAPALAARAATLTIPIVFTGGSDPVRSGLVTSFGRPGGNATGVLNATTALTAKRLALLREAVPSATLIAVLVNPANPDSENQIEEIEEAARTLGQHIMLVRATTPRDLEQAFASLLERRAGALFATADPMFTSAGEHLATLTSTFKVPSSYSFRTLVVAGGLMSYGPDLAEVHRQAGLYTGRILRGAKPADLPVLQPTKLELVINQKAARSLGLTLPRSLLLLSDEVIQ
jgi:ABC-type uncharacterized transport system substrate-binding protein